jgi:hypothetical protein
LALKSSERFHRIIQFSSAFAVKGLLFWTVCAGRGDERAKDKHAMIERGVNSLRDTVTSTGVRAKLAREYSDIANLQ